MSHVESSVITNPPTPSSFPLDFSFRNNDEAPILFSLPPAQTMNLQITNTSSAMLTLDGGEGASKNNWHFALGFRPGTLAEPMKISLTEESQTAWTLHVAQATDGKVWLYLLAKDAQSVSPADVVPVIRLDNMIGDGGGGSHGTNIILRSQGLRLAEEQLPTTTVREYHLAILNVYPVDLERLEEVVPPITVELVDGWGTVMPGQKSFTLKLSLRPNRHFESINHDPTLQLTADSKLFLHSDDPDLSVPTLQTAPVGWKVIPENQLNGAAVGFHPDGDLTWTAAETQVLTLEISSEGATARTSALRLRCQGIRLKHRKEPFEDFTIRIPLRVGPLVVKDGNVGIGTQKPKSQLHVASTLLVTHGENRTSGIEIIPTPKETQYQTGGRIFFRENSDENTYGFSVGYNSDLETDPSAAFKITRHNKTEVGEACVTIRRASGNVGIGTTDPKNKLDVEGAVAIGAANSGTHTAPLNGLYVEGNVGIGTPEPKGSLHVNGDYYGSGHVWLHAQEGDGRNGTAYIQARDDSPTSHVAMQLRTQNKGKVVDAVRITKDGNVGIGTTNPTMAKLEVNGDSPCDLSGQHGYLGKTGAGDTPVDHRVKVSIYASNNIVASRFEAVSDSRIKRIKGRSDAGRDLATLQGIEVTDYTYIDTMTKGTAKHKKVIGQQVEKVFPQAVSTSTDVVPDIYQKAAIKDGWVEVETELKKGDRVRLISEKKESIHEVLEVADGRFRTNFAAEGDRVFVYGREVNDFRTVDYDAIAMLNVSATQQIKKEKDAEIKALQQDNASLLARLERLESLVEGLASAGPNVSSRGDDSEEHTPAKNAPR